MKMIEEFIEEIKNSTALQDELKAVKDKDAFDGLLKKYDVSGTVEDFGKAIMAQAEGEVSDSEAENVAGGFPWKQVLTYLTPGAYGALADYLSK